MRTILLTLVAAFAFAASASAETVTFHLSQGTDTGFGFSWLHPGSGTGTGFAMNGNPKTRIDGSFSGDWNAATKTLSGITGTFTAQNTNMNSFFGATPTEQISVSILDGKLRGGLQANGLPGGDQAGGYLKYRISGSTSGELDTGQFSFAPRSFAPAANPDPNSIDYPSPGHDFAFWGNNWVNADPALANTWLNLAASLGMPAAFFGQPDGTEPGFRRLGTDLRGPAVPEPGFVVLALAGAAALAFCRRAD